MFLPDLDSLSTSDTILLWFKFSRQQCFLSGPINITISKNVSYELIISENPNVKSGGHWEPHNCTARQKLAIIIPFRNREPHLKIWLYYMHPFLQRQQAVYAVYVIEQTESGEKPKIFFQFISGPGRRLQAKLINVGFTEAAKDYDYDCFIFSDVDIIPMDLRHLYRCSKNPRHLANAVDKFNFTLLYETLFGGIVAFTKEQFLKINGFSNTFWGWGGEDDELYNRVMAAGMQIERQEQIIARSKMIFHHRDPGNEGTGKKQTYSKSESLVSLNAHARQEWSFKFLASLTRSDIHLIHKAAERMSKDGLTSLSYNIIVRVEHKLFTKITVDIGAPQDVPEVNTQGLTESQSPSTYNSVF
ncbi:beta-1,4-galactosyltransferase 1-like [Pelobates cultripes]|uniref:Beta-1,4-galactosyltransferase n=1 Tax=Pelobates cultripes TaxID=61616 RepID=A0AAD1W465_PELCU|nr:beta-1,4-galactosyltransferase 1-like [Pelobates cultripes]